MEKFVFIKKYDEVIAVQKSLAWIFLDEGWKRVRKSSLSVAEQLQLKADCMRGEDQI